FITLAPPPTPRLFPYTPLFQSSVKLRSQLRGDLDWVVMKCLEKNRSRRYETANGLAMDLKRFLHNEPVVARPPSATYRLEKLVRDRKSTRLNSSHVAISYAVF